MLCAGVSGTRCHAAGIYLKEKTVRKNFSLSTNKAARILGGVLFTSMVTAAAATACLSLLSYHHVLNLLNHYAADGRADTFPEGLFTGIILRMRLLCACMLILTPLAWAFRARILEHIQNILGSAHSLFADTKSAFSALAAEPAQHVLGLCAVFIVGCILRIYFIGQPIRSDEAHTFIYFASKPLIFGLTLYPASNNHLFNTLLMHICNALFGNSLWVLRLPALCAGLLLIACFYCWARLSSGRHAALLSAGLIAISPVLIEYSTNARGYMLETLLFGMLLLLMQYVTSTDNALAWFLFTLCAALGFYTVPVMVYPYCMIIVAIAMWCCCNRPDGARIEFLKKVALSIVLTLVITIILYVPVVIVTGADFFTKNSIWNPKGFSWLFSHGPQYAYTLWLYWNKGLPDSLVVLLAAGFILSLCSPKSFWPASILVLGVVSIIALIRVPQVPGFNRVWIFAAPLYYMSAACGLLQASSFLLKKLPQRRVEACITLFAVVLALVNGQQVLKNGNTCFAAENGGFRDAENVALFLKPLLKKNDKIICQCPSGEPLQYYFIRQNTPLHFYSAAIKKCQRIFIIVNTFHSQTLGGVLREAGVNSNEFEATKLLAGYETGLLYEMQRY
jgi:hypothetical protein